MICAGEDRSVAGYCLLQGGILILTLWGQHWEAALGHFLVLTLGILQKHSVKHRIKITGKNLV